MANGRKCPKIFRLLLLENLPQRSLKNSQIWSHCWPSFKWWTLTWNHEFKENIYFVRRRMQFVIGLVDVLVDVGRHRRRRRKRLHLSRRLTLDRWLTSFRLRRFVARRYGPRHFTWTAVLIKSTHVFKWRLTSPTSHSTTLHKCNVSSNDICNVMNSNKNWNIQSECFISE